MYQKYKNKSLFYRLISLFVAAVFFFTHVFYSANTHAFSSPSDGQDGEAAAFEYAAMSVTLMGVNINPVNPLKLDFIIDAGQENLTQEKLQQESMKMIRYFLTSLTLPEDEMWVNLSPYEKDRIFPEAFGRTEMGYDLLAQDYTLKQFSSSLMNPESEVGRTFWDKVYKRMEEDYGIQNIPIDTFNKIWIVPDRAFLYEHEKGALLVDCKLKVMLEEDYLAMEKNKNSTAHGLGDMRQEELEQINELTKTAMREILIPVVEKEVNEGELFANLRQVFHSAILAAWYKQALKNSFLGEVYVDQRITKGVDTAEKDGGADIFNRYVSAFEKGISNYMVEEYHPAEQKIVMKKYVSGGATTEGVRESTNTVRRGSDEAQLADIVRRITSTTAPILVALILTVSPMGQPSVSAQDFTTAIAESTEPIEGEALVSQAQKDVMRVLSEAGINVKGLETIADVNQWRQALTERVGLKVEWGALDENPKAALTILVHGLVDLDSVLPVLRSLESSWGMDVTLLTAFEMLKSGELSNVEGLLVSYLTRNIPKASDTRLIKYIFEEAQNQEIQSAANNKLINMRGEEEGSNVDLDSLLLLFASIAGVIAVAGVGSEFFTRHSYDPFNDKRELGGIDMNLNMMNMTYERQGNGIQMRTTPPPLQGIQIESVLPQIINIAPITNIPQLIGLSDDEMLNDQLSMR